MDSEGFYPSAKKVFDMIWSEGSTMAIVAGVGSIFEMLGSLTVALLTTFSCYQIIQLTPQYQESIHNIEIPLGCIFLISILIGTYFMGLFGHSADTLIILFLKTKKEEPMKLLSLPSAFKELGEELAE